MLKNLYYQIFDRKKFFSSSNDFKEFENYRIGINTSRTNICILYFFLWCFFYVVLAFYFIIDLKAINKKKKQYSFFIFFYV